MEEKPYKFVCVNDEKGRVWDIYAQPLGVRVGEDIPISCYVVNFSQLRLQEDCGINFMPITQFSSIEELKKATKKCLSIALSNFGSSCPGFENFLISFCGNTDIRNYIETDNYMQALLNQLVFDVLYDYNAKKSDKVSENMAAKKIAEIVYYKIKTENKDEAASLYQRVFHTKAKYDTIDPYRENIIKGLNAGLKAEKTRSEAPHIKNNIESMGLSPDDYSEHFESHLRRNPHAKKTLSEWVNIYINQKQEFVSSFQYRKTFKSKGNNISGKDFINDLWMYNIFRDLFTTETNTTPKKFFEHTMIYYSIESYKRIDFMLYLLEKAKSNESILHDIDNLESSFEVIKTPKQDSAVNIEEFLVSESELARTNPIYLQTSTPAAFLQRHIHPVLKLVDCCDGTFRTENRLCSHPSQKRSPVLLEKALLDYALCIEHTHNDEAKENNSNCSFDYFEYFQRMDAYMILRNKAYEIFSANFTFGSRKSDKKFTEEEYREFNKYLRNNYSLTDFHKSIKTWGIIKETYEENIRNPNSEESDDHISKNDKINLLKKHMMILSSYLFPNVQS